MVLQKCEWGHDDYSLNVGNLPLARQEADVPAAVRATKADVRQSGLFDAADT